MSLFDELKNAASREKLRLHTPGHKGKLHDLDLTELTDDSFPAGHVADAERRAADFFGAKHARYLCGGSSQGVKSAIFYAAKNAVVDVDSHRSVFDGFKLSGKRYVTVGDKGGVMPITAKQIQAALTPDIGAVVVTSPTYYGFCADIDGIAALCKSRGLLFIVDGAHGAHFGLSPRLPKRAAPYCDICNVSTHKTLSALTQSAVLLDNLAGAEHDRLNEIVDVMGSTSPSYLLYASIDYAVSKAASGATAVAYDALYDPITRLKKRFAFLHNDDFTRLVLDCAAQKVDAARLNSALAEKGVFSELADGRHIVFIFTAENSADDVELLGETLADCITEMK